MSSENDVFIINKIYPDAKDIFNVSVEPIVKLKDDCLFVLDTNALLLPFTISPSGIEELKKVYTQIINDNRLFIPAQVAREFAKNRPERIKEIFSQFEKKKSNIHHLKIDKYPLLDGMGEYEDLINFQKELNEKLKEYSTKVNAVIEKIKSWTWDDPVSQIYYDLFKKETIIEHSLTEEEIIKNLDFRYQYQIPPGYKDKRKKDDGIGDLLIWFTILELAEKENKNIVFVSGDEKTDWFHRSEGQSLYPRFELISEFRTKAPGKSFNIIRLSEFIELFGADQKVVEEVESEENIFHYSYLFNDSIILNESTNIQHVVEKWLIKNMIEYRVTPNIDFSDFLLTSESNEKIKIGVEVVYFTEVSPFLTELNSRIEKSIKKAKELNHTKVIFCVIAKPLFTLGGVFDKITSIVENFSSDDMEVQVLAGRIINNEFNLIHIISK